MKKGLILGAAALATVAVGPIADADAGEVKLSGYYMFRMQNYDMDMAPDSATNDDGNYWTHRLSMQFDMKASEKTHAHMKVRVLDGTVDGADSPVLGNGAGNTVSGTATTLWSIRSAWLETEAYGVGLKMGKLPIVLNDRLLVSNDGNTTSFGTFLLSKSFGDVTVVAAQVKVDEGNANGASTNGTLGASDDDADLYALSLLGKVSGINWQLTGAHLTTGDDSSTGANNGGVDDLDDTWLALTLGGEVSGVNYTLTGVYEAGLDSGAANLNNTMLGESGVLVGLRLKGKTGFGGWNAYGFYGSDEFTNITNDESKWSPTWDMGGTGGKDMMKNWSNAGNATTSPTENMWGIGAGLTVKAGGWTIKPSLDYASVVENDYNNDSVDDNSYDSAFGGSLLLSTSIDKGTSLNLGGGYLSLDESNSYNSATQDDSMHVLQASIKMKF
uniref:Porin domain-containing protein n=1 Tax=Magnetococcus massalia (strain MO-1) TaxID=451514 RepID=A0A1S7LNA9_MAGMO|nr:conserved exported protein of unknown function [Candidatus Magnetococcus massalia]